jgi:transmembrane sensor
MESSSALDALESAAATWLLREESEEWSPAQQQELEAWLAASPGNRVCYIRLKSAWRNADRLKSIATGIPKGAVPAPNVLTRTPYFALKRVGAHSEIEPAAVVADRAATPIRHRARWLASAASVVVVAGLAFLAYASGLFDPGVRFTTPVGGLSTVPAEDGSVITLNTNTAIRVRMSDTERRVDLDRGEAFFEVAHDTRRPFAVYANDRRVVAVGTKFAVRIKSAANPNLRVAVTEGVVRLEPDGGTRAALVGETVRSQETPGRSLLEAGAVADITEDGVHLGASALPEAEEALSWRNGYVVLRKTPLAEAIAELNRYNKRQLVIADSALSAIVIGGNFRTNNLDGFLRLLEQGFDVQSESLGNEIRLSRKRDRGSATIDPR